MPTIVQEMQGEKLGLENYYGTTLRLRNAAYLESMTYNRRSPEKAEI
jgi:hypothetical protein